MMRQLQLKRAWPPGRLDRFKDMSMSYLHENSVSRGKNLDWNQCFPRNCKGSVGNSMTQETARQLRKEADFTGTEPGIQDSGAHERERLSVLMFKR